MDETPADTSEVPPGQWHMYRRDQCLTGRAMLPGEIERPAVLWTFPVGGSENECIPLPAGGSRADLLFAFGGCAVRMDAGGAVVWKSPACGINAVGAVEDLDGDGRLEIVCSSGYEVIVLAAESGAILMRHYVGFPLSSGTQASTMLCHRFDASSHGMHLVVPLMSSKEVLVFDFRNGNRRGTLARSLWMDDAFHPTVAAADMDGDGVDELVVSKLCGLYVFDVMTGVMKTSFRWTSGGERHRNYGLLQLVDIDGDGAREVVIVAERVARHISVIDNDGAGNLSLLWDRFVEFIYPEDTTELRHTANSVADVDGDGKPELVVGIYNGRKDGRWWLEVLDPLTGGVKQEFPDRYLWGVQDVDGDGVPEILMGTERKRVPLPFSDVEIVALKGSAPLVLWQHSRARFAAMSVRPGAWRSNFRPVQFGHDETWTASADGETSVFLFLSGEDGSRFLGEAAWTGGRPGLRMTLLPGPGEFIMPALADVYGDGVPQAVISCNDGRIFLARASRGITAQWTVGLRIQLEGYSAARPGPIPAVYRDPAHRTPLITIPDNTNTIHQLTTEGQRSPVELWRKPGRGWMGYDNCFHAVYVRDVDDDGRYEILVANPGREDCSELMSLAATGEVKQSWAFREAPPPASPRIGLYEWVVVDCAAGKTITASSYASASMNSERTVTIDLEGRALWKKEQYGEGEWGRGVGPWSAFSILRHGDGRTEILFLAKDHICRADAATGAWVRPPWILWHATNSVMNQPEWDFTSDRQAEFGGPKDPFTAYGSPVLIDVDNDGETEILVAGCFGGYGVLRQDNSILWWKRSPFTDMMLRHPGIADVYGDGRLCVGVCHADGEFVCLEASSGSELWSIALGSTTSDIASCDIDGDGKEEFIVGATDGRLMAIGVDSGGEGVIRWTLDTGYALGSPVVADADGDGVAEILVVCGNGQLLCVGKEA